MFAALWDVVCKGSRLWAFGVEVETLIKSRWFHQSFGCFHVFSGSALIGESFLAPPRESG